MTVYRTSSYVGSLGAGIAAGSQGGTSMFTSGGGSAVYGSDAKTDATCGLFTGQGALQTSAAYSGTLYWRGYFKAAGVPDANRMIVDYRNAGATSVVSLGVDTSSKWRLRNTSGTTTATSVTALVPGTWYGILYTYNTATGAQSARFYDPDGIFLEEISGAGTAGTITEQREGVLQGASTWSCSFDDTSTANTVLALTGTQIDPGPSGPGDPYRVSDYDGIPGGPLGLENGNGYLSSFDGAGGYVAPGFASGTVCGRYVGQYALRTQKPSFGAITYWKGWIRAKGIPDENRSILEMQTIDGITQASVSIDAAGAWRIRRIDGVTVATTRRHVSPGTWYGALWTVNRTTGTQTLSIYSYFGALLETISGPCDTGVTTTHLEGCTTGRPTWYVDFDSTVLHRVAQTVTSPLTEAPSTLQFRNGGSPSAPVMEPMYWDGTTLTALTIVESY